MAVSSGWSDSKGLSDFIQLSHKLSADECIILVGAQDGIVKSLPDNVIPFGRTSSQKDLALLYQMSDIVISLSHVEAMGLTPIEGMACGKPAIVYDNSALPELVNNETGIVVKTGNIDGVVEAIGNLRQNKSIFMSEQCRNRAVQNFNKDKCFEKYIKLYEQILKQNKQ